MITEIESESHRIGDGWLIFDLTEAGPLNVFSTNSGSPY